jgi:hypothetical protein
MSSIVYLALTLSDDSMDTTTDNSEPEQAAAIVGSIHRARKPGCKKQVQITSPTPSQSPGPKSLDPDTLFILETMEVLLWIVDQSPEVENPEGDQSRRKLER